MKNIDLEYICTVIGNLSGIPIRLYQNKRLIFYHSIVRLPKDPIVAVQDEVLAIASNVGYFVTPRFLYYGIVNSANFAIVIGPTQQVRSTGQELRELAFQCDAASDEIEAFVSAMNQIVAMPLESVMQMLCTVNYILNDEKLGLEDISIYDSEQQDIKNVLEAERLNRNFKQLTEESAGREVHNTLALEQTIMNIVRKGDTAALKEWISSAPAIRGGVLATDQLRQLKNTFIVTATLVSRASIRGGLNVEDALSLSDAYIKKCELFYKLDQIINLQYHMVLDFTERVEKLRLGKHSSKLVLDILNYIRHHLSETITAEEIARHLFISRPYLSSKFKADTGENLTDFILKEKTEEAKRLLRYTDKSLLSISSYLGFSSQSHFSRVFKKYTGYTPNEFRDKQTM